MTKQSNHVRSLVQRKKAENHLLLMLLSFAVSISVTRLFLQITGYPQIGKGELHIAHVLWGGLLLFIASLLPVMFANERVLTLASILSGVGVGLFIDEVGKFITQKNDYFYPSAAPIIYSFFLLTVLLYIIFRKRKSESVRSDLYSILEDLQEVIDQDLSERELNDIKIRLNRIANETKDPNVALLSEEITHFVDNQQIELVPEYPTRFQSTVAWLTQIETRVLTQMRFRAILSGGMIALAMWLLVFPISILSNINSPQELEALFLGLFQNHLIRSSVGLAMFSARIGLEGSVGLLLFVAAVLLAFGRDRQAVLFAYLGLLISLTIVNIFVFYFDQFSTIINASIQFIFLLGVIRYRKRFLRIPV
jgi:hypothetical protein